MSEDNKPGVNTKPITKKSYGVFDHATVGKTSDGRVEVNVDIPQDDGDELILRMAEPKAAAFLMDNYAGSILRKAQEVKPFQAN